MPVYRVNHDSPINNKGFPAILSVLYLTEPLQGVTISVVDCPARDRLSTDHHRAIRVYTEALAKFLAEAEIPRPRECRELEVAVAEARIDMEVAALLVEKHVLRHGCRTPAA
jgi:hypothetical protein